jgi:hypothetical protein
MNLTIEEQGINDIIAGIRLDTLLNETEKPPLPVLGEDESFLVLEQRGLVRLSEETRQRELLRLAKRKRKKYTLKPGTRHHKTKARTERLRKERRWQRDPVSCLTNSWGYWTLDRELWDQLIKPLWTDSQTLKVVRTAKGTKSDPHTIWNIKVVRGDSVLYDGNSMLLYRLSCSDAAVPASLQE